MQFIDIVNDVLLAINDALSSVIVKKLVNDAIKDIAGEIALDANVAELSIALMSGVESYGLPGDFSQEISIKQVGKNVLDRESWYLFSQRDRTAINSIVSAYAATSDSLYFNPLPQVESNSASTVCLVYLREPENLSDDHDVPGIPKNFHNTIRDLALLKAIDRLPAELRGGFADLAGRTQAAYDRGIVKLRESQTFKGSIGLR